MQGTSAQVRVGVARLTRERLDSAVVRYDRDERVRCPELVAEVVAFIGLCSEGILKPNNQKY